MSRLVKVHHPPPSHLSHITKTRKGCMVATSNMNVVRLYGSSDSECGYCKGSRAEIVGKSKNDCSRAYTIVVEKLHPSVYEELLRRGWRRSGVALYKPDNWLSCCPAITIRLTVNRFSASKGQRRILRQMESLLRPEAKDRNKSKAKGKKADPRLSKVGDHLEKSGIMDHLRQLFSDALAGLLSGVDVTSPVPSFKVLPPKLGPKGRKKEEPKSDSGSAFTLMSTICAATAGRSKGKLDRGVLSKQMMEVLTPKLVPGSQLRPSPKTTKVASHDMEVDIDGQNKRYRVDDTVVVTVCSIDQHEASGQIFVKLQIENLSVEQIDEKMLDGDPSAQRNRLAEWCKRNYPENSMEEKGPYELAVTTIPAHESALDPNVHRLYWKYQTKVHGDADPFLDNKEPKDSVESTDWASRAPEGWKEKVTAMLADEYKSLPEQRRARLRQGFESFYDFLVDHPFAQVQEDGPEGCKLGAYHQQYRLNGLLIAVGVVDILPEGLSSVYLYYDPSFADELVPLGKYSILREIQWTQDAKLPFYYLVSPSMIRSFSQLLGSFHEIDWMKHLTISMFILLPSTPSL